MNKEQQKPNLKTSFLKATRGFISILPMLFGVILLVGIFQTYITSQMLQSLFQNSFLIDMLTGTIFGAVSSGNPITSYIISEELLNSNISLFPITAFILAWVTLGIIQLPAEVSVFGFKFTLLKNLLTFFSTLLVAYLTVVTLQVF